MSDLLDRVDSPWLLWLLAGSTVAYTVLRQAAESSKVVADFLGPVGRRWASARAKRHEAAGMLIALQNRVDAQDKELSVLREQHSSDAWNADLKRQVDALDKAVIDLRRRGQIVDAYLVYDEDWHRRELLAYGTTGYEPLQHRSFLEFEADWLSAKRDRRSTDRKGG